MSQTYVQNLEVKFQNLLQEANTLLEQGDLENTKAKREEAEGIQAQIKEWRQITNLKNESENLAPQRPPLPGADNGHNQIVTKDDGSTPREEEDDAEGRTIKAAYIRRFGTPEEEIKGIMRDLHGEHYAGRYWEQKAAFNRYIRHGDAALGSDDRKLLKTVIFTPEAVKAALSQGVSEVEALKTTMVAAADSLGGYTIPVDTQSRIIQRLAGKTIVRGRARKQNTSRDKVEFPRMMDNGGDTTDRYTSPVRVRWVSETPSSLAAQNITFGMEGVTTHTSMAEAWISRNLLEDTAFDIEDYLEEQFAQAAAFDEDDQFMFGDGVGKPRGILPGYANLDGLYEVTSGATSSPFLTWDKLIAVEYEIPRQYRGESNWYFNRRTVRSLRQLKDETTGEYYWTPFHNEGGAKQGSKQLLDYSVLEHETFPDLANGAYFGLFGDMSGYQIIDRIGMTVERFVDSYTARQNLVCFVMRRRLGGKLLEPWRMVALKVAA